MFFGGGNSYLISLGIILAAILWFMVSFERKKPREREVVLLAAMTAIAIAGRVAFFMVPQVKPSTAIIIITGIMLGKQAGFLCGALTAFISDFAFGQGPWTPWQMAAFGLVGFTAALIFQHRESLYHHKSLLCVYGFLGTVLIYGLIMDTGTALTLTGELSGQRLIATYLAGLPFNVIHGGSTAVTLWIFAVPMFHKLDRIKMKYGMYYQR